jgi:putative addiction module killer protein
LIEKLSFISYNYNMSGKKKTLIIFKDKSGKEPFTRWLESIKDRKTRTRIYARLDRLEVGNPGDNRSIENGVFELRLQFGPGYRIYYGEDGKVLVILLTGGDKKTQSKDIKKALFYWKSYKEAKE